MKIPQWLCGIYEHQIIQYWALQVSKHSLLDIHSNGILSTTWCPHDPRIVASSSWDGRTVFWEADTGKAISSFADSRKF